MQEKICVRFIGCQSRSHPKKSQKKGATVAPCHFVLRNFHPSLAIWLDELAPVFLLLAPVLLKESHRRVSACFLGHLVQWDGMREARKASSLLKGL